MLFLLFYGWKDRHKEIVDYSGSCKKYVAVFGNSLRCPEL